MIGVVWLAVTAIMTYVMYHVLHTEPDKAIVWSWIVMSILIFSSASFLAYNVIFQGDYRRASDDEDSEE